MADPLAERLGAEVALAVGRGVAGRGVATGGFGVALGVGVGAAFTVTWPAGRSATLPVAVAEKVTLPVPTGRRRDPRHTPFEVVPLTLLNATVRVPTWATTLFAGFPA
jgi:hypothetical protein